MKSNNGKPITFTDVIKVIAVLGGQWGDEGKGKLVDLLAELAYMSIRFSGGCNAGHTLRYMSNGELISLALHLVPSSVLHKNVLSVLGSGVLVDPNKLGNELIDLDKAGVSYDNFCISSDALLSLPQYVVLDCAREYLAGDGNEIGTTKSGIGPGYVAHTQREGLVFSDLFNKDVFVRKLRKSLSFDIQFLEGIDRGVIREKYMKKNNLEQYYCDKNILSEEAIVEAYMEFGRHFKSITYDTDKLARDALHKGKNILLEGAQATLLDLKYGSYPFVTSSHPTRHGIGLGSGLGDADVDLCITAIKAPYMTRVGSGSFPTEIQGTVGDYLQERGEEFGATTGRPRRTGWLDLPLMRHNVRVNGPDCILTKFDVAQGLDDLPVCDSYTYAGPDYCYGNATLRRGDVLTEIRNAHDEVLQHCKPHFVEFDGFSDDISDVRNMEDFPLNVRRYINCIENMTGANVIGVSVGPKREQIAWR